VPDPELPAAELDPALLPPRPDAPPFPVVPLVLVVPANPMPPVPADVAPPPLPMGKPPPSSAQPIVAVKTKKAQNGAVPNRGRDRREYFDKRYPPMIRLVVRR
jgi:hypothetical protein